MIAGGPGSETGPRLVRASTHLLVLTPIRLGLGLAGLVAASLGGLGLARAAAAFALAAIVSATLLVADRRFQRDRLRQPLPLPDHPNLASWQEIALAGIYPSTVAVAVLTAASLLVSGALAAFMAGILAGMGIATIVSFLYLDTLERRLGYRLYYERGPGNRAFAAPR
jgi:membrane protein implicated in regulation of membrane protease activity